MTLKTVPGQGDDAGGMWRFQTVWKSGRRDVLTGLGVIFVAVLLASVPVDGAESHDLFASSEHLRLLAESERLLVPAVRRYVADERQRLLHILRYDVRPAGVTCV